MRNLKFEDLKSEDLDETRCQFSNIQIGNLQIIKKWQVTYIAPLQPPTLAAFPPWGSSAGAGRARPAGAKIGELKKV
jgi:hypothetical protein